MKSILCTVCALYLFAVLGRIIFSWIPISADSPVAAIRGMLVRITEPLMGPLRRALPPVRFGGVAFDLSPIVLILGLQIVLMRMILRC